MSDADAACMNFVNALQKIPGIIAQYEERTAKLKADDPQLEAIISKTWSKEDELKQLKSELAALDRKITAELGPTHEVPDDQKGVNHNENDDIEVMQNNNISKSVESPSEGFKKSMVAEPPFYYRMSTGMPSSPTRHSRI